MILTVKEMKDAETKSNLNEYELIHFVGKKLFQEIRKKLTKKIVYSLSLVMVIMVLTVWYYVNI